MKSRASLRERLLAEIASVQLKQIDAIDAYRQMSPVEQCKKDELAVTGCGNQFAVG